jgi:hypothetical protein
MPKSFLSTLAATLLSATLALGGLGLSAGPARADNEDAVRILGGILAIYALSRAIEMHNDRDRHVAPPPPPPNPRIAPARCFIEGRDFNGYFRGYVRRCMINNVPRPELLPAQCLRQVHTDRGLRRIYGGRCLFQNGWVREVSH